MHKIWLIIQREYLSRVKKKSFLVMTFLRPIELLAPELADLRPMLILSILLFIASIVSASSSRMR